MARVDLCSHIGDRSFLDDVHRLVDASFSGDGFRECAAFIGFKENGEIGLSRFVCGDRYSIPESRLMRLFSREYLDSLAGEEVIGDIHTHPPDERFGLSVGDVANAARMAFAFKAFGDDEWWTCNVQSAGLGDVVVHCGHVSKYAFSSGGRSRLDDLVREWFRVQREHKPGFEDRVSDLCREAFIDFTDERCAVFEWR